MDLGLDDDLFESFRIFQGMNHNEYARLVDEYGLIRIDATETLVRQQQRIREIVEPHLQGVRRVTGAEMHDLLRKTGLQGRYLVAGGSEAQR